MISGFEFVKEEFKKGEYPKELPHRATAQSAGYDFYSPKDIMLHPGERTEIWTNVRVALHPNQLMTLRMRSSLGCAGLELLADTIDADYFDNAKTGGNIRINLRLREGFNPIRIESGDRIVQGIVSSYETLDADNCLNQTRQGGHGSTGGHNLQGGNYEIGGEKSSV